MTSYPNMVALNVRAYGVVQPEGGTLEGMGMSLEPGMIIVKCEDVASMTHVMTECGNLKAENERLRKAIESLIVCMSTVDCDACPINGAEYQCQPIGACDVLASALRAEGNEMTVVHFIDQDFELTEVPEDPVGTIAAAARTCYKSEAKAEDADERLVRSLIRNGHHAMLEFASATVMVTCDRGISHELVRHRLCSFAQESQRYVDSGKRGFEFILPDGLDQMQRHLMEDLCEYAADRYAWLRSIGTPPELARYVLPNATATRVCCRANLREWRHFFELRCASDAHPMMRELARRMLADFKKRIPVVFDDLTFEEVDG